MDKVRIDAYLSQLGYTRSYAAKLIEAGRVKIDGTVAAKASIKVDGSEVFDIDDFEATEFCAAPEDIPLLVLYEDDDLLVVDKPRGMVVHPSRGHLSGTLVNALLGRHETLSSIGGMIRPGIIHRLDKDTSGLIIVAKNDAAHRALSAQIEARRVERTYYALVYGIVKDSGTIETHIARDKKNRLKMAVVGASEGRIAITNYTSLYNYRKFSLVEANLVTGRTHQIRVHMAHIGHPVAGDPVYSVGFCANTACKAFGGAQVLHSKRISFEHPRDKKIITVESDLPQYFLDSIAFAKNQ